MTDLCRGLETATFAEKQNAFRFLGNQQIHNRRGIGRSNPKIDHRQATTVGRGLHRTTFTNNIAPKPIGEALEVVVKVGQQNIVAQVV